MAKLTIDEALKGLARGAAKFGRSAAAKAVARWNGIAPKEQEPYGKGMGGSPGYGEAGVENDSDAPMRLQRKKEALEKALAMCGDPEIKALIDSVDRELAAMPAGDKDGRQEKDSTTGGQSSAAMNSKCPACGHEDEAEWGGKCAGCGVENEAPVGYKNTPSECGKCGKSLADGEGFKSRNGGMYCDDCKMWAPEAKEEKKENACPGGCLEWTEKGVCKKCGGKWDETLKQNDYDFEDKTGAGMNVRANSAEEAWGVLANALGVPVEEAKAAATLKNADPGKAGDPCQLGCGGKLEQSPKGIACPKCEPSQFENAANARCEGAGPHSGGEVRAMEWPGIGRHVLCKACWDSMNRHQAKGGFDAKDWGSAKPVENAGHLGPESWDAADLNERAAWLESAGLDIELARFPWVELSMDAHKQMGRVLDKPSSINNAAEEDHVAYYTESDGTMCKCGGKTAKVDSGNKCKNCGASVDMTRMKFSNAGSEGDLEEIARHAEGIEHEVEELANASGDCPDCKGTLADPKSVGDAYGGGHHETRERGHGGQRHLEVNVDGAWEPYCASYQNARENAGTVHYTFGDGTEREAACGAAVSFGSKHAALKDVTCPKCLEDLSGKKQNGAVENSRTAGSVRGAFRYGSVQNDKLDKAIEQEYYRQASGVQINIMSIGKIYADCRAAIAAGETLESAMAKAVAKYRLN